MTYNVIMSGFGGQGVMLIGQLLAYAGMVEDKYVTWMPSYGPEMRGGTANCSVVVSDEPVASPIFDSPNVVVAMNIPSLTRFENNITRDGILLVNTSVIDRKPTRKDIKIINVPCNEVADKIGNQKVSNMVMLGALMGCTKMISIQSVEEALKHKLTGKKVSFIEVDKKAINEGISIAKK